MFKFGFIFIFIIIISIHNIDGLIILFVLADDMGWGDLNFTLSGSTINTPTIYSLSQNGIILSNYYVQPICTPTRCALLSSKYPIHTGLQHGVILDSVPAGLPFYNEYNNSLIILPNYIKQNYNNWETHMIGKWHLGFYKRKYTPQMRGFDTFYGYYTGNEEYWNHTSPCWNCGNFTALDLGYHNISHDIYDYNQSGIYSTNLFTNKAMDVIREYKNGLNNGSNNHLFLYLPFEAVHGAASCDPGM